MRRRYPPNPGSGGPMPRNYGPYQGMPFEQPQGNYQHQRAPTMGIYEFDDSATEMSFDSHGGFQFGARSGIHDTPPGAYFLPNRRIDRRGRVVQRPDNEGDESESEEEPLRSGRANGDQGREHYMRSEREPGFTDDMHRRPPAPPRSVRFELPPRMSPSFRPRYPYPDMPPPRIPFEVPPSPPRRRGPNFPGRGFPREPPPFMGFDEPMSGRFGSGPMFDESDSDIESAPDCAAMFEEYDRDMERPPFMRGRGIPMRRGGPGTMRHPPYF